ncbi:hypothetical protein IDH44_02470 [Paenibacillus sp. IB182496]|uniref:Uncharacterized protein n=1 Tax=Paenibacillus sabuli TaxID=2772509 RepID=A0A927BPT1_9BACL|nr:hypothetical protein [Paenibacillus sabuli]MBD2844042.1 hypothetical protein [Paenibacillus sabuli]
MADNLGRFESPISLPAPVNYAIVGAGLLAGYERALMFRSHWLLDAMDRLG